MGTNLKYKKVVATGGIGTGMLFHSQQMETLGRSESRLVILSNAKDYCKQQIVLYYLAMLTKGDTEVFPIGYVGNDSYGSSIVEEMEREGMDVQFIGRSDTERTMISICLQYPDKEGANFTAINNAAERVTEAYVLHCMRTIGIDASTIVVAIPEVPIDSRIAMLREGKQKQALCAASVPVTEADEFLQRDALQWCDILAVNEEEAQAFIHKSMQGIPLIEEVYRFLAMKNKDIQILVTCGEEGAYFVNGDGIEYIAPLVSKVANTTGAGDAMLGGILAGIAKGMPFRKGHRDSYFGETKLSTAFELGTLCAGMAVESEDSIAFEVTQETIIKKIEERGWKREPWFIR